VSKYDPNGNFIVQYTNTTVGSPAGMSSPLGLAVNSGSTTLYVSDSGNQRILAMPLSSGVFSTFVSSLGYTPQGLAINGSDLYVAGAGTAPTSVYNYLLSNGSAGSPPVAIPGFNSAYDIAFDINNNLYVSDTYNGQVEEFTANNYALSPSSFIGVGILSRPEGIATDSLGNVYVVDSGNGGLFQFP
ncbi:MAG TPA: NHL repeat-containing protein, partial [bacterium]|nr:NHL repeat-containing protein [bacterium]